MFVSLRVKEETKVKAEKLKERYGGSLVSICQGVFDAVDKLNINPLIEVEGKDKALQAVAVAVERQRLSTTKRLNEIESLYMQPINIRVNEILQVLADSYSTKILKDSMSQTATTPIPPPTIITEENQKNHELTECLSEARRLLAQVSENITSQRMPGGKVSYQLAVSENVINAIRSFLA